MQQTHDTEKPIYEETLVTIGSSGTVMRLLEGTEVLTPEEMLWNLCGIYRFAGALDYSVAQHTLLVAHLCPGWLKAQALVHDLHESICSDVPTPIKRFIDEQSNGGWTKAEAMLASRVRRHFRVPVRLDPKVHECDMVARGLEVGHLANHKAMRQYERYGIEVQYRHELRDHFKPKPRKDVYVQMLLAFKKEGLL